MPTSLDKQRRNLLILESIILILDLTNTKIKCIPLPLLKEIDIEKLSFMGITSYNHILMYMLVYFGLRFLSHLIDNKNEFTNKSFRLKTRPRNVLDKVLSFYGVILDLIFKKGLYDLVIPFFFFTVITYGHFVTLFIFRDDSMMSIVVGFILSLILVATILINEYLTNKKMKYTYIEKDENLIKLREKYKNKKEQLNQRKSKTT